MVRIRPFRGLRPAPDHAAHVVAPPYDVLSSSEARARAEGKPWSFLHISKPEIDLPQDIDPYDDAVYAKGAETMARMVAAGVLVRDPRPCFYAYRLSGNGHTQTGLAAVASVADYDEDRIRRHELTTPVKETDRVRQIEAVNAQTGPVMAAYPEAPEIDSLIAACARFEADVDVTGDDGIRHQLWVIDDDDAVGRLAHAFEQLPALYITDGHHRSAAASRVCASRSPADGGDAEASHRWFLCVAFPDHQLRILDYNRLVRDLNGRTPEALLAEIADRFAVDASDAPVRPSRTGTFGMYMDGRWYRLAIDESLVPESDPLGRLDLALLGANLIEPVLGVSDPRRDERIAFVGGSRGLEELQARVDAGEMAIAFSLYPTRMEDLIGVADAGEIMPPKSTWFDPKLADGLVSHVLD